MNQACLSLLLLALLAAPAAAADPTVAARTVTLPNGLTLLLLPDTLAASVDVGVWVRAGSIHEKAGATGLSHLVERLMYAGTPKRPAGAHARAVLAEGGTFSGQTTPDWTLYSTTVPPEGLEAVLEIEADRFAHTAIGAAALERARRAVREEGRGRADRTPAGHGLRALFATAFAGHPYAWPVVGRPEDLARVTLQQASAFRAARHAPARMRVTIAGRFDVATAVAAARRTLGTLPAGAAAAPAATPPAPAPQAAPRRARAGAEGTGALVAMGWRTPPQDDPDAPAVEALARILAGGAASRVQRELVRPDSGRVCAAAQGGLDLRAAGGLLHVLASPAPGADTATVERALAGVAARLAEAGPTEPEVASARRGLEVETRSALQSPAGLARLYGAAWLTGGRVDAVAERLERVRALTPADVQRAARRVLSPTQQTVVIVTPAAAGEVRP
jgi:zinc protease